MAWNDLLFKKYRKEETEIMPGSTMDNKEASDQNQFIKQLPPVAIVMVTRNRCEPLMRLFSQLGSLNYPKELIDIYLVDSASVDDTVENVKRYFPGVNLITIGDILGIAAGFNTAIQAALNAERDYKYIWLLDDDAEIESQTLMPLIETAEKDPNIAVVGSAVYEPDNRDQLVSAGLNINWKAANIAFHIPKTEDMEGLFDVEIIPACSALTRADVYRKLGLWDKRFWLYWGDTEWCTRALRNGYRVCCNGKSRVWHRNWAHIKPDFYFPYVLHDRIRSALLFNLLYNPSHAINGVRNLILMSYLKAAFENLTLRPNFTRAYVEGVQDFLKGNFTKKDFSDWSLDVKLFEIHEVCKIISGRIQKNPRIIINQINNENQKSEIKEIIQKHFSRVIWEEIPAESDIKNLGARERLNRYLFLYIPQLLFKLFPFYRRRDLIISPVAVPFLYNIVSARHTILLAPSGTCYMQINQRVKGFGKFLVIIIKGFKAAYIDFPRSLNKVHSMEQNAENTKVEKK